jgi:dienelactone hydrolase
MRIAVLFLAASLFVAQDGVRTGTSRSRPLPGAAAAVARFELPPEKFDWTLSPRTDAPAGDRAFNLTFPSAVTGENVENNTVTCRVWMPKDDAPSPRPGVVLLHYLRGTFKPMEEAGRYFAAKGFVAMLVYMPHYGPRAAADRARRREMISDNVADTVANFRQAVLDIRRAGDWLRSQKGVDPNRVGLFGVSMGAVVGALVAGVDLRFTRTVLVVGGGDLPALVLHESRETREMRKRLLDGGWTAEKLATALAPIEPIAVAPRIDPANVLLINALGDQVVPKECTEKLCEAMGGPRLRWIKSDHYTIALALLDILKESAEHLAQRPRC